MTTRPLITTISLAGLLALTGCAGLGGDAEQEPAADAETAENSADTDGAADAPDDASEEDGGTEDDGTEGGEEGEEREPAGDDATLTMDDAVETITYSIQGDAAEGEITMGLQSLELVDDAMLLTLTFMPEYEDSDAVHLFQDLHGDQGNSVLAPVVNDRANLKAYHVPRQTQNPHVQGGGWIGGSFGRGTWASPVGDVEAQSGELITHWAYFPAPEDDIDTVDVAVVPGVQEFQDVEIQR